jgi:hypothetical protein
MIMVDDLRRWPTTIRCFKAGSCHLTTDGMLEELHAFAHRLGMRRQWYQEHRIAPHYDLTASRRERALEYGAVFVPMREQIRRRRHVGSSGTSGESGSGSTSAAPVKGDDGASGVK